jgi:hypothetical protein
MVFKDFYWSEYILSSGNKKDSCEYLLYALFISPTPKTEMIKQRLVIGLD